MHLVARIVLTGAAAGLLVCEGAGFAVADDAASTETRGSAFSLIDNSHADSWLEVDRTANAQLGSGTAGSDHDGGTEVRTSDSAVDSAKTTPPCACHPGDAPQAKPPSDTPPARPPAEAPTQQQPAATPVQQAPAGAPARTLAAAPAPVEQHPAALPERHPGG